jgi:hypothetical protein
MHAHICKANHFVLATIFTVHSADTERLAQHVRANGLAAENAAMSARMATLASQIQDSRAAVEASERRAVVTAATQAELHAQLAAALLEYRTNDIICVGLRDSVARLQQKLVENQATRDKQVCHTIRHYSYNYAHCSTTIRPICC